MLTTPSFFCFTEDKPSFPFRCRRYSISRSTTLSAAVVPLSPHGYSSPSHTCTSHLSFPFVTKDIIYRYKMKDNLHNKNYFLSVSDIIIYLIEESSQDAISYITYNFQFGLQGRGNTQANLLHQTERSSRGP